MHIYLQQPGELLIFCPISQLLSAAAALLCCYICIIFILSTWPNSHSLTLCFFKRAAMIKSLAFCSQLIILVIASSSAAFPMRIISVKVPDLYRGSNHERGDNLDPFFLDCLMAKFSSVQYRSFCLLLASSSAEVPTRVSWVETERIRGYVIVVRVNTGERLQTTWWGQGHNEATLGDEYRGTEVLLVTNRKKDNHLILEETTTIFINKVGRF